MEDKNVNTRRMGNEGGWGGSGLRGERKGRRMGERKMREVGSPWGGSGMGRE